MMCLSLPGASVWWSPQSGKVSQAMAGGIGLASSRWRRTERLEARSPHWHTGGIFSISSDDDFLRQDVQGFKVKRI
jgi:hypothetical protein